VIRAFVLLFLLGTAAFAAEPVPLLRAHAHNDYEHARPLFDALEQGFCSVEADVWLVDGKLLVAHDLKNVKGERTLAALYLDPLRARIRQNGGRVYRGGPTVTLLVDVKSEAAPTYAALHEVLKNYSDILTAFRGDRTETKAITVIVSGNRAREEMTAQSERYAAYDGRTADLDAPGNLIPWISENTEKILGHKWQDKLSPAEHAKLKDFVARAHAGGRKVRFWNTPDREDAWAILTGLGVDLINTDNLPGLARFLRAQPAR
jgi:glycerophosphoryl diester phosphodiesterase